MQEDNNLNGFSYTYSAPTEEERRQINSIRRQYMNKDVEPVDKKTRLKQLHSHVITSASVTSLTVGIIGTLIFGLGMTMVLEWQLPLYGVITGIVGAIPMALAYPVYKLVLKKNKEKHGEEILRLSAELLGEDQ